MTGLLRSRKSLLLFFTTLTLLVFSTSLAWASPKRIGITRFESDYTIYHRDGTRYDIGIGAADMLAAELTKNKNFLVIERQQLRAILKEQALGRTGVIDPETAAAKGRIAGLNYIVYGKVTSAGAERKKTDLGFIKVEEVNIKVSIAVRMIDASTGAVVWADQAEGVVKKKGGAIKNVGEQRVNFTSSDYDEALKKAIHKVAAAINGTNPLEGSVAQANGRKVYLDIGVDQGVQPGQIFTIYREGPPITTADGRIIGVDKFDICTVRIVRVDGGMSVAEVLGDHIPSIKQNDKARLQP